MRLLIALACLCLASNLSGQKFNFGVSAGIVASQIDGDNLRGFNKIGYQVGLLGGYSINASNSVAVELRHASFGSVKKKEQTTHAALDLRSIDVVFGYTRRFGDTWDGQQRFKVMAGPRIHRIIEVKGESVGKADLRTFFFSAHFAVSHLVAPSVQIELSYTHGLTDILDTTLADVSKLQPYFLSLGVSYFLGTQQE